jgi:hypothetical protein
MVLLPSISCAYFSGVLLSDSFTHHDVTPEMTIYRKILATFEEKGYVF